MRLKSWTVCIGVAIMATTAACEKASPTRPTDVDTASAAAASVTDARTGATIIAARPSAPAANADIRYADQPITLSVLNATTTGSSALTYTFEVAGDAGFSRLDFSRNDVPAGAGGSTSINVDKLGGSRTYYWRVRANSGSGAGPYSQVRTFNIGPEVVLGTPVLTSPISGANAFSPLTLSIANIAKSGPFGPIIYTVDVAADEGFGNILYTGQGAEQSGGQTTTITAPVSGLIDGATYYWRARATDTLNDITTPYSSAGAFKAQSFNFAAATHWDNPDDVGSWPVGAKITMVEFTGFSMRVDFDRRTGPNKWPSVDRRGAPPGGGLQYTLGLCINPQNRGQWHCSAVVQFWEGRSLDDTGEPFQFPRKWWYEPSRWGPMTFYRPAEGEIVGVYVGAGDLRTKGALFGYNGFTRATCPRVCEVSNVALVPFSWGYARYDF